MMPETCIREAFEGNGLQLVEEEEGWPVDLSHPPPDVIPTLAFTEVTEEELAASAPQDTLAACCEQVNRVLLNNLEAFSRYPAAQVETALEELLGEQGDGDLVGAGGDEDGYVPFGDIVGPSGSVVGQDLEEDDVAKGVAPTDA